jgi:hypothetical protein
MLAQYIQPVFVSNAFVIDVSNYDYVVAQFVAPTGTISITSTNDSGDVQGTTDGNYTTAANFTAVYATKLSTNTAVTAVDAAGLYKINVAGRYLKFGGTSAAASKIIIMLAKIS